MAESLKSITVIRSGLKLRLIASAALTSSILIYCVVETCRLLRLVTRLELKLLITRLIFRPL